MTQRMELLPPLGHQEGGGCDTWSRKELWRDRNQVSPQPRCTGGHQRTSTPKTHHGHTGQCCCHPWGTRREGAVTPGPQSRKELQRDKNQGHTGQCCCHPWGTTREGAVTPGPQSRKEPLPGEPPAQVYSGAPKDLHPKNPPGTHRTVLLPPLGHQEGGGCDTWTSEQEGAPEGQEPGEPPAQGAPRDLHPQNPSGTHRLELLPPLGHQEGGGCDTWSRKELWRDRNQVSPQPRGHQGTSTPKAQQEGAPEGQEPGEPPAQVYSGAPRDLHPQNPSGTQRGQCCCHPWGTAREGAVTPGPWSRKEPLPGEPPAQGAPRDLHPKNPSRTHRMELLPPLGHQEGGGCDTWSRKELWRDKNQVSPQPRCSGGLHPQKPTGRSSRKTTTR
ncbi:proline-rich protein 2-like isoform X2 [Haemorhous mexicanus]|uniref:proline-rich protein 2-like isoform X2 n=1 Tax=Haemorhous mexicanus TaxID=30427 RepID=UPI0028BEFE3B|nr:proline-rich protein 2-like isoform X2 [Haemorhous mexicanus]